MYGYSHLDILLALSAVNAFYFGKSILTGIIVSMLVSFLWPKGMKPALLICGMLFIGFNVFASIHYDLSRFASCPRAFYSFNGLFIGMAITLGCLSWLEGKETGASQNGDDAIVLPSVTEPLRRM
jgi:hypothetical protein